MMKNKILITGSSGFIGSHLVQQLLTQEKQLICPQRSPKKIDGCACPVVGEFTQSTNWSDMIVEVHTVIHCAARVHVMNDAESDPLQAFRAVNVAATLQLAKQAAAAGVSQFIYLSSVKVNGETTAEACAFDENSPPQASDPYGISKLEAERALVELGTQTGMAITLIRPPLVYGRGVGANFLSLLRWVKKGVPLPLGSIHNKRSFVFVKNLTDFIGHCIQNPNAYNQTFLVSDGHDLSTTELLKEAATALDVPARLIPFPAGVIRFAASLVGRKSVADRLCLSLQINSDKAQSQLHWRPPFTIQQGLRESGTGLS
jgi:nucleoside-diphosphate-sugar epimerase